MKLPILTITLALLIPTNALAQTPNVGQFQPPATNADASNSPAQVRNWGGTGSAMRQGKARGGLGQSDNPRREAMRQRMIARFDTNHDGQLDAGEKARFREMMQERRAAKAAANGQQGQLGSNPLGTGPGAGLGGRRHRKWNQNQGQATTPGANSPTGAQLSPNTGAFGDGSVPSDNGK